MIDILIKLISILSQLMIFLVISSIILSYLLSPYHPVRRTIDQVIEPLLAPIRRVVPMVGIIDFSPLVLIILIQLISYAITRLLTTLR
jgi:YggT family protein